MTGAHGARRTRALARVGDEVGGKYRLERLLGVGSMAAVYAARHRNGHRVAVKLLHAELRNHPEIRARFLREAYLGNRVPHERVPRVIDDAALDDATYLVMDLLEGATLGQVLARRQRLTPCEAALLARDVLEVLVAAHAQGIVHRDIKPENLFVRSDGRVCVLDFGIARLQVPEDALGTAGGLLLGTPAFMAPEQALGRRDDVGPRSDLWSLGATLFTALTGEWVHRGDDAEEVLVYAATRAAEPIGALLPTCPPALAALVDRALRFEVEERWPTGAAMLADATRVLETLQGAAGGSLAPLANDADVPIESIDGDRPEPPERAGGTTVAPGTNGTKGRGGEPRSSTPPASPAIGESSAPPKARRSLVAARPWVVAAMAALAGAAVVLSLRAPRVSASSSPASAAPPPSDDPDLRAAVRAWKDAAIDRARTYCASALEQRVARASAHLFCAVSLDYWTTSVMREQFGLAVAQREQLGSEDAALLDAFEPSVRFEPDLAETRRRLEAASARFPDDPVLLVHLAKAQMMLGELRPALGTLHRALARDATLAVAEESIGLCHVLLGDVAAARAAFDRCLAIAPSATHCLERLGALFSNEGACAQAEVIARRRIALDAKSPDAQHALAEALYAVGQPLETVSTALAKSGSLARDAGDVGPLVDAAHVAVLRGDFAEAAAAVQRWRAATAPLDDEADHLPPAVESMMLASETGDLAAVGRLAREYTNRFRAWQRDSYSDYSLYVEGFAYALGGVSRSEYVAFREAWLRDEAARPSRVNDAAAHWYRAYAVAVADRADAEEALAHLRDGGAIPDPLTRTADLDRVIGRVYLLAGDFPAATTYLTRASQTCSALDYAFESIWATFDAAVARERSGDLPGACAGYRRVASVWRAHAPASDGGALTSRTARAALERLRALRCDAAR